MLTEKFDMFIYKYLEEYRWGPESRHSANVQDISNIPFHLNPASARMRSKAELEYNADQENPFVKYQKSEPPPIRANYVERHPEVAHKVVPELGAHFQQQTVQKQPVSYNPQEVDELPSGLPNG